MPRHDSEPRPASHLRVVDTRPNPEQQLLDEEESLDRQQELARSLLEREIPRAQLDSIFLSNCRCNGRLPPVTSECIDERALILLKLHGALVDGDTGALQDGYASAVRNLGEDYLEVRRDHGHVHDSPVLRTACEVICADLLVDDFRGRIHGEILITLLSLRKLNLADAAHRTNPHFACLNAAELECLRLCIEGSCEAGSPKTPSEAAKVSRYIPGPGRRGFHEKVGDEPGCGCGAEGCKGEVEPGLLRQRKYDARDKLMRLDSNRLHDACRQYVESLIAADALLVEGANR